MCHWNEDHPTTCSDQEEAAPAALPSDGGSHGLNVYVLLQFVENMEESEF
jgi:hypothetical protein